MLEQFWYELIGELVFVEDHEGFAIVGPSDQIGVLGILQKAIIRQSSRPRRMNREPILTCVTSSQRAVFAFSWIVLLSSRLGPSQPGRRCRRSTSSPALAAAAAVDVGQASQPGHSATGYLAVAAEALLGSSDDALVDSKAAKRDGSAKLGQACCTWAGWHMWSDSDHSRPS